MGSGPNTIADALEWLRKHFQAEAARGVAVAYQMELSGPGGGVLSARVDDGVLALAAEALENADVVYRMSALDFFGVLAGERNPDLLFMEDRIQVEGDLSLALKLRTLFRAAA